MYESRQHPPIPRTHFMRRLALHFLMSLILLGGSLFVGMAGYAHYEQMHWRDAFINAAMLLGGMGPVNAPVTDAGKVFAGFYALYAGLVFLIVLAISLTPVIHRLLHTFHWEEDE